MTDCTIKIIKKVTRYKVLFLSAVFFFCTLFYAVSATSSRILNAIGITGGVTFSDQKWKFSSPDATQRNKFIIGFNGSIMAELFARDYTSIISELQYNQKGCTEKDTAGNRFRNKVNY